MSIPGFVTGPSAGRATESVVVPQVDHGITLDGVKNIAHESLMFHFGKSCYHKPGWWPNLNCIESWFYYYSGYTWNKIGPAKVSKVLTECCG